MISRIKLFEIFVHGPWLLYVGILGACFSPEETWRVGGWRVEVEGGMKSLAKGSSLAGAEKMRFEIEL